MLGKTHIAVGIGTSLIFTQPKTLPEIVIAAAGGAIGGWIVDIDIKGRDIERNNEQKRERIYDAIINLLFIAAFFVIDFVMGQGMCRYIVENWGMKVWGALFGILIMLLVGVNTKHRTFTHSFLAMYLFGALVYLFCRPATVPFFVGYTSHLFVDFFNKLGLQLFFPVKWRPCLKVCHSNKKANKVLFLGFVAVDIVLGATLISRAMMISGSDIADLDSWKIKMFFATYLIFINLITFLGFQKSYGSFLNKIYDAYQKGEVYEEKETPELRFQTWCLNFLVFIGGGVGMFLSLVINLAYPAAYNGMWWSFCYSSIMFWGTVYLYIFDPHWGIKTIEWISVRHLPILIYVVVINAVSALFFYIFRKKRFNEYSLIHTMLWLLGACGGTIGGIMAAFAMHHEQKYYYASRGFFVMLFSQLVFMLYILMVGIL